MQIDEHVQAAVAGTCGNLYLPLVGQLTRYPIPTFPLRGSGALLDIGCGWGRWTIAAAHAGFVAEGIDPDGAAVAAAQRIAAQIGSRARFAVGRAEELPFADASFDAAFSFSVLQHLPADTVWATFQEIRRVLRPGGVALVEMPNRYGALNTVRRLRSTGAPMRYYTPAELRQLGQVVGATTLEADAFLSLNAQPSDIDLLPPAGRAVVRCSTGLCRASRFVPGLRLLADSMWIRATKAPSA